MDESNKTKIHVSSHFYYTCHGRLVDYNHQCENDQCLMKCHIKVLGGKGGFGSMLRALGARIEKTTNHEACRDLNGRRMRDVNNEKNIADWLKKKDNDEAERKEKRQKKLENIVNPKHQYEDKNYTTNLQINAEKVDEALKQALEHRGISQSGDKRKNTDSNKDQTKEKKKKIWLGLDDDEMSSEEEEEDIKKNISTFDENTLNNKDTVTLNDSNEKASSIIEKETSKDEKTASSSSIVKDTSKDEKRESSSIIKKETSKDEKRESSSTLVKETSKDEKTESSSTFVKDTSKDEKTESSSSIVKDTLSVIDEHKDKKENICNSKIDEIKLATTIPLTEIDLASYNSADQLEEVGLERLKVSLIHHGLKCGGTLQERAKRFFLLKTIPLEEFDKSLFAKKSASKKK